MNQPEILMYVLIVAFCLIAAVPSALAADAKMPADLETREFAVRPAEIVTVTGEKHKLSAEQPNTWASKTKLMQVHCFGPGSGIVVVGAVDPASIVVRHGEKVLKVNEDYVCDPAWAAFGIGRKSSITPDDEVLIDYRYSLRRIDSLVRTADGEELIVEGKSELVVAKPPALAEGQTRLANIVVDFHSDGKSNVQVLPLAETAAEAQTASTPGRRPKATAKIKAGQPLTIVCWGDSVTCGGDATPGNRYPEVLEKMLKKKFPDAPITVNVIAIGGSNSRQWLYPGDDQFKGQFDRIVAAKPDVVTIEFVNDFYGLGDPKDFDPTYEEILKRFRAIDAEIVLITPHFVHGMPRDHDNRPYVANLKRFAEKHDLALADASARWAHLWREGLPYITLLANNWNHPDDRGHRLFAEELIKCFEP